MALLHQVEQASGRGDDELGTAAQRVHLGLLSDSAKNERTLDVDVLAVVADALVNLNGELAGRREN